MTVSNLLWNCFELKEITVHLETDNGPVSVTWKTSNEELKDAGCVGAVVDLHDEDVLLEKINSIILVFQDTNRVYLCFERARSYIRINLDPEWEADTGVVIEKTIATRLGAILRQGIDGINEILDARDEFLLKYRPNGCDPEDVEKERLQNAADIDQTVRTSFEGHIHDPEEKALKLLSMAAVNLEKYRKASSEAVPDQCDDRWPEDFIELCTGPFAVVSGCGTLAHMMPDGWGFIPDTIPEELFANGDFWWSLTVRDELGRHIRICMEQEPNADYASNEHCFTIYVEHHLRTMDDIQELVMKYEPQIDHWWCHRAQPAVSESV